MFNFAGSAPVFREIVKGENKLLTEILTGGQPERIHSEKFILYPGLFCQLNILQATVYAGQTELYQHIRAVCPEFKPNNICLSIAARFNHTELLAVLLQEEDLDPTFDRNEPIRLAAEYGSVGAVKCLLQVNDVDASDALDYAFRKAVENKHKDVVEVLSAVEKVDPLVLDSRCLVVAAENNDTDMIRYLVEHTEISASAKDYLALDRAVERQNLTAVTLIYDRAKEQGHPLPCETEEKLNLELAKISML